MDGVAHDGTAVDAGFRTGGNIDAEQRWERWWDAAHVEMRVVWIAYEKLAKELVTGLQSVVELDVSGASESEVSLLKGGGPIAISLYVRCGARQIQRRNAFGSSSGDGVSNPTSANPFPSNRSHVISVSPSASMHP